MYQKTIDCHDQLRMSSIFLVQSQASLTHVSNAEDVALSLKPESIA